MNRLPDYFKHLKQILMIYIDQKVDHWTLQTEGGDYEIPPYVQGLIEFDGSIHLEATSNEFLEPPLDEKASQAIRFLGWQLGGETGLPNYWLSRPVTINTSNELAELLCRTLYEIYGVDDSFTFTMSPHPKEVGIKQASLIFRGENDES